MIVFDERYNLLRDEFVSPLVNYQLDNNKQEYNNLKYILLNSIKSVNTSNGIELFFDKDVLMKALLGDVDYFYTRALVQYVNIENSSNRTSDCWGVVTQYYFSYFSITTLLRITNRGSTYLNPAESKQISLVITALQGSLYQVNAGNYLFEIKEYEGTSDLCLELIKTAKGTHETTWSLLSNLVDEMLTDTKQDTEYTIFKTIREIINNYQPNFPSTLRNSINYRPHYGYLSIENKLTNYVPNFDLGTVVREILKFDSSKSDEDYKIKISALYGTFFFILTSKLYNEYLERSVKPRGSQKIKNDYIKKFDLTPFDFPNVI